MADTDILEDILSKLDSIQSDKESQRCVKYKIASNLIASNLICNPIRQHVYTQELFLLSLIKE